MHQALDEGHRSQGLESHSSMLHIKTPPAQPQTHGTWRRTGMHTAMKVAVHYDVLTRNLLHHHILCYNRQLDEGRWFGVGRQAEGEGTDEALLGGITKLLANRMLKYCRIS